MFLQELEETIKSRAADNAAHSYTAKLLHTEDLVERKVMEEAFEVCRETLRSEINGTLVAQESADLLYHLLVLLRKADVSLDAVLDVLKERSAE